MRLYELLIGFRYLKSKKNQGIISFNTILSIFIVFLGVFTLIVVLAVMNGFQSAIKDKILDIDAHITVTKGFTHSTEVGIKNYDWLIKKVRDIGEVKSVDPYIMSQALFRFGTTISPVIIRGVGNKGVIPQDISKFIVKDKERFYRGDKKPMSEKLINEFFNARTVFIGEEMAANNNIFIGDYIELIVPKGMLTVRGEGITPGIEKFRVVGFFKTQYYDYDTKLVIMSLKQTQRLFEVGDVVSGIGIKIKDIYQMKQVAGRIKGMFGFEYFTMTAEEKNRNLFYALELEKLIIIIIQSLIFVSAGFTIMGTLVMVVMEKRKSVGILQSMGATPNSLMIIFILEGFLIGVIGSFTGVVCGIAASLNLGSIIFWIENSINNVMTGIYAIFKLGIFQKISLVPSHVYYIEGIPTEIKPEMVVLIAVFAVFLSTMAAVFPAWSASRQRPVETIRYE
jgi:lipoprotein-releasing system permease protein